MLACLRRSAASNSAEEYAFGLGIGLTCTGRVCVMCNNIFLRRWCGARPQKSGFRRFLKVTANTMAGPRTRERKIPMKQSWKLLAPGTAALSFAQLPAAQAAWEPTRPVEFIIPAGTGGGADQMARTIQGIVSEHNLMKQPMVVINKAGGPAAKGSSTSRTHATTRTRSSSRCRTFSPRRWRRAFPSTGRI